MTLIKNGNSIYTGWFSIGEIESGINDFQNKVGYQPGIVHIHHDFLRFNQDTKTSSFQTFSSVDPDATKTPLQLAEELNEQGSILAVTWNMEQLDWSEFGYESDRINFLDLVNGKYDSVIRAGAQEIAAFGKPIMMNILAEYNAQLQFMNGPNADQTVDETDSLNVYYGDPDLPDAAELVKDAYKHVIDIFREEGATNASWFMYGTTNLMDPNDFDFDPNAHPQYVYPGDDYIDWVGQTAVVSAVNQGGTKDQSLAQSIQDGYDAWTSVTDKPYFLPEFAFEGDGLTDRSDLIEQTFLEMPDLFPNVKAFTITDNQNGAEVYGTPWLNPDTGEIDAWNNAVADNSDYSNILQFEMVDMGIMGSENSDDLRGTRDDDDIYGFEGDDVLYGHRGDDIIFGHEGNDILKGNRGDDFLSGDSGHDVLRGNRGDDILEGGSGNDKLSGGRGDDILIGGTGSDVLIGGLGADIFVLDDQSSNSLDIIRDFNVWEDILMISDLLSDYDPVTHAIEDFVEIRAFGYDSFLAVNSDGQGVDFTDVAMIRGSGYLLGVAELEENGSLIIV